MWLPLSEQGESGRGEVKESWVQVVLGHGTLGFLLSLMKTPWKALSRSVQELPFQHISQKRLCSFRGSIWLLWGESPGEGWCGDLEWQDAGDEQWHSGCILKIRATALSAVGALALMGERQGLR